MIKHKILLITLSLFLTINPCHSQEIPNIITLNPSDKMTVDFYKIDIHNVFRLIGHLSGKNIAVDENIKGTITLQLQDVSWRTVLEIIKDLKGLDSYERDNVIVIIPSIPETDPRAKRIAELKDLQVYESTTSLTVEPMVTKDKERIKTEVVRQTQMIDTIIKANEFIQKGEEFERRGQIDKALENYKKASEIWPDNVELLKKIAIMSLTRKNDELTAINYGKLALKYNPNDAEAANLVAISLAKIGKNKEAKIYFERAIDSENVNQEIFFNYAVFAFSNGLYNDAIRIINKLESQFKLTPESMLIKAQSYEILNNINAAIVEYNAIANLGNAPNDIKQIAIQKLQELKK